MVDVARMRYDDGTAFSWLVLALVRIVFERSVIDSKTKASIRRFDE